MHIEALLNEAYAEVKEQDIPFFHECWALPSVERGEVNETVTLNPDKDPNFNWLEAYFAFRHDKTIGTVDEFRQRIIEDFINFISSWAKPALATARKATELAEKTIRYHTLTSRQLDEHTLDVAGATSNPLQHHCRPDLIQGTFDLGAQEMFGKVSGDNRQTSPGTEDLVQRNHS